MTLAGAVRAQSVGGAALLEAACSISIGPRHVAQMGPREAVMAAADAAPGGVTGIFSLCVRASGRDNEVLFLNSELDYRDQRNISIAIAPATADALATRLGELPDTYFRGKWIEVAGTARRVRIDFRNAQRPTGLYYYQTHVAVADPEQVRILGACGTTGRR